MGTAFPPRMAVLSLFSGVSPKFRPPELSHLPVDNFNDFGYNQIQKKPNPLRRDAGRCKE